MSALATQSHWLSYPFSAIVGQARLKQALLMVAGNPRLRGVLLFGEKGTAKSTAARALAELLPPLPYVEGCPFHCHPDRPRFWCNDCRKQGTPRRAPDLRPAPFVTLPLNATLDRVIGTIHWERALRSGTATLEPGLLAQANGGVLYVDEVNLLDEGVVAALLDAAEGGVNHVCREGVTLSHPASFILIGTMNPEEGPLRPQLLDRFGLVVSVTGERDPRQRATLVRRRLAFEANPEAFRAEWEDEQERIRADIVAVRARLPEARISAPVMREIAAWASAHGVAGHRADILLAEAARAIAAWAGERVVTRGHLERASEFVILHRRRETAKGGEGEVPGPGVGEGNNPNPVNMDNRRLKAETPDLGKKDEDAVGGEMTRGGQSQVGQMFREETGGKTKRDQHTLGGQFVGEDESDPAGSVLRGQRTAELRAKVSGIADGLHAAHLINQRQRLRGTIKGQSGRRAAGDTASRRGRYYRARRDDTPTDLAFDATVRAAAMRAGRRAREWHGDRLEVDRLDLHQKVRRQRTKSLILFVVDASGSLGEQRMSLSKGAVMALLRDAYQKRDKVAMVAFRDYDAPLLLPPTNSVDLARRRLTHLPTGGKTPLVRGIVTAYETIRKVRRRDPHCPITVIILSDGRANVGLRDVPGQPSPYQATGYGRLWKEIRRAGEALAEFEGVDIICVDTTPRHKPPALLLDLARHIQSRYVSIDDLQVTNLLAAIASAPSAQRVETVVQLWR